jgi:hypothetical protein
MGMRLPHTRKRRRHVGLGAKAQKTVVKNAGAAAGAVACRWASLRSRVGVRAVRDARRMRFIAAALAARNCSCAPARRQADFAQAPTSKRDTFRDKPIGPASRPRQNHRRRRDHERNPWPRQACALRASAISPTRTTSVVIAAQSPIHARRSATPRAFRACRGPQRFT